MEWHNASEVPEPGRRVQVQWNDRHGAWANVTSKLSVIGRTTSHRRNDRYQTVFQAENHLIVKPGSSPDGGYFIGPSQSVVLRWRYLDGYVTYDYTKVVKDVYAHISEGEPMFSPTTVQAKGGYRAQVTYNYKVVWESTEIYQDDPNFGSDNNAVGGQTKAQNAAQKAVDQAVGSLFSNVQE